MVYAMKNCTDSNDSSSCKGNYVTETIAQNSKSSEDEIRSRTAKRRREKTKISSPATISINGVINIHNASNVHFGHTYRNESIAQNSVLPEPIVEKSDKFKGLLASDREISNQHRITVSSHVGSNWRHLGNELGGFSNSQMDQLEEKFKAQLIPFDEMICQLILKWENHSQIKPTIGKLAQALFKCQMNSALLALIALEKFN